jgi:CDGSH-type Zn-finger protein
VKDGINGWDKRHAARRNIDGVLYSQIRFTRCVCGNSRPADQPFCDRCDQLHELGYRTRRETDAIGS